MLVSSFDTISENGTHSHRPGTFITREVEAERMNRQTWIHSCDTETDLLLGKIRTCEQVNDVQVVRGQNNYSARARLARRDRASPGRAAPGLVSVVCAAAWRFSPHSVYVLPARSVEAWSGVVPTARGAGHSAGRCRAWQSQRFPGPNRRPTRMPE